jgi:hypothetical protein
VNQQGLCILGKGSIDPQQSEGLGGTSGVVP